MTKIKLCGMRRAEDIQAVNELSPEYIGFICNENYWRYVSLEKSAELKRMLHPDIRAVGVFVDDPFEKIADYLKKGIIDVVQLHGSEDEYYIQNLRNVMLFQGTVVPIIKAFRVKGESDLIRPLHTIADFVLLDSGAGTGETFDWSLLQGFERDFFLAGGLGPDNTADAVKKVHPYAVDMSSGIETEKCKDPEKMRLAVAAVRNNS